MKSWLKLACRLSPLLVLLACAGGGGGGTSGSAGGAGGADGSAKGVNGNKNNQDTNNTNITGGTGYDLSWGTPDPKGPGYAKQYDSGSWQPAEAMNFWGQKLTGCEIILRGNNCISNAGPSLAKPAQEVVDAWNLGWTGKGVNVLIEDFTTQQHGVITTLLAYRYAPGATLYGLNIGVDQQ